jgi:hypothetical protein
MLYESPWPAEDGGPTRLQAPHGSPGIGLRAGERLAVTTRDALASTMLVLREPGEVFLLRHSLGARPREDPVGVWVERIDPVTLAPLARSPALPAGPFWPGGMAAHANGSLHVVWGRWCHRLSSDLEPLARRELPRDRPYNSFATLACGAIVTKDIGLGAREPARLCVLDPGTLERLAPDVDAPEPSVARLSADGDTLYLVGDRTIFRYRWTGERLELDRDWRHRYRHSPDQGYGWDVALAGGHAWFMDNGEHDYVMTMLGAGVARGAVHLIRVSLDDPADHEHAEVCGLPRGAVTNPPLYEPRRRIAIAYDSANGVLAAFRLADGRLVPLWQRALASAGHLLCFPDTGELVAYDFHAPPGARTRLGRRLAERSSPLILRRRIRRAAARGSREDVVLLDIETGVERGRATVPAPFQSVLFPCPGWNRDLYYCSFSTVARVSAPSSSAPAS